MQQNVVIFIFMWYNEFQNSLKKCRRFESWKWRQNRYLGTEGEQWQVFDMRDGRAVSRYIRRLAQHTKRKWGEQFGFFPQDKLPDSKDVKELASMLRGNFDKVMSIGKKIAYRSVLFQWDFFDGHFMVAVFYISPASLHISF